MGRAFSIFCSELRDSESKGYKEIQSDVIKMYTDLLSGLLDDWDGTTLDDVKVDFMCPEPQPVVRKKTNINTGCFNINIKLGKDVGHKTKGGNVDFDISELLQELMEKINGLNEGDKGYMDLSETIRIYTMLMRNITEFDLNECEKKGKTPCDDKTRADCVNYEGGFNCSCKNGYDGDGHTCIDIDECKPGTTEICFGNTECRNTEGSYVCGCKDGYNQLTMFNNEIRCQG